MYTRSLLLPKKSFILLGPRGCGKSTWLKTLLKEAPSVLRFDLLRNETFLNMQSNPSMLRELIEQKKPKWVIIDEIQKLPAYLEARLVKIEQRLKIAEMESKGGIDLKQFYKHPDGTINP